MHGVQSGVFKDIGAVVSALVVVLRGLGLQGKN
jgi:hypothetical protein